MESATEQIRQKLQKQTEKYLEDYLALHLCSMIQTVKALVMRIDSLEDTVKTQNKTIAELQLPRMTFEPAPRSESLTEWNRSLTNSKSGPVATGKLIEIDKDYFNLVPHLPATSQATADPNLEDFLSLKVEDFEQQEVASVYLVRLRR